LRADGYTDFIRSGNLKKSGVLRRSCIPIARRNSTRNSAWTADVNELTTLRYVTLLATTHLPRAQDGGDNYPR